MERYTNGKYVGFVRSRLTILERICKALPAIAMLSALVSMGAVLIYYGFWVLVALRNYILK